MTTSVVPVCHREWNTGTSLTCSTYNLSPKDHEVKADNKIISA